MIEGDAGLNSSDCRSSSVTEEHLNHMPTDHDKGIQGP